MMANPEMPGTQEEATALASPTEADAAAEATDATEATKGTEATKATKATEASEATAVTPEVPRPRREPEPAGADVPRRPAPAPSYEPEQERMPLLARVLLADVAVAVAGLILLFIIEVQRFGDASMPLRRRAWGEDLVVLFGVSVLFAVVTLLLIRARHARVAIVQAVVTALVLTAAITSAATGNPKPTPAEISSTTGTSGNPG
jgi:hypothetical protein